jgi:hypothetical protein
MDVVSLALQAITVINTLMEMREEVVWNKDECKRLLNRIDGLLSPIEKIKNRIPPDVGQQQLLENIVVTIERASEFVQEFRHKKSIYKWLKRKNYKDDFKSFHEQVSQHVSDLNLGETAHIGEELHIAFENVAGNVLHIEPTTKKQKKIKLFKLFMSRHQTTKTTQRRGATCLWCCCGPMGCRTVLKVKHKSKVEKKKNKDSWCRWCWWCFAGNERAGGEKKIEEIENVEKEKNEAVKAKSE